MNTNHQEEKAASPKIAHRRVDAVGCGLFFIWLGIAILADVGWGIALIGMGGLILGLWAADAYIFQAVCRRPSKGRY